MKVLRTERSMEPCLEGGYLGYYFYLECPVDEAFVENAGRLGALTFMRAMKKPFFLVRGRHFVIRGQLGDAFCKVGIEAGDTTLVEHVRQSLEW